MRRTDSFPLFFAFGCARIFSKKACIFSPSLEAFFHVLSLLLLAMPVTTLDVAQNVISEFLATRYTRQCSSFGELTRKHAARHGIPFSTLNSALCRMNHASRRRTETTLSAMTRSLPLWLLL